MNEIIRNEKNGLVIGRASILFLFVALYPILPGYFFFYHGGINEWLAFGVALLEIVFCIMTGGVYIKHALSTYILLLWACVRTLQYLGDRGTAKGLFFFCSTVFCGYFFVRAIANQNRFIRCLRIIVYASGFVGLAGIFEEITRFNLFSLMNTAQSKLNYNPLRFGLLRIIGFTQQTIVYALYCMFVSAIVFYLLTLEREKKHRRVYIAIYILIVINALLTLSRSSILAFIACNMLLLYGCGYRRFFKTAVMAFLGLIGVYVLCLFIAPQISAIINNIVFMMLALFNDDYTGIISDSFGNDNLNAIGNRLDLYSWVWESTQGALVFGKGASTGFEYNYTAQYGMYYVDRVKTGIEVQYLNVLYHFGFVGLVTEVMGYIALLVRAVKCGFKPARWEGKISFSYVFFCVMLTYLLEMFAVNQSSEVRIFYTFTFLFLAYSRWNKYQRR